MALVGTGTDPELPLAELWVSQVRRQFELQLVDAEEKQ